MTERRVYYDATCRELLLMTWVSADAVSLRAGWQPDLTALDLWRAGALRLYDIAAGILTFIENGSAVEEVIWPHMIPEEHADITALVSRPWIPADSIFTDMSLPAIRLLEGLPLTDPAWEEHLRPALDYSHLPPAEHIPLPLLLPPAPPAAPPAPPPEPPPLRNTDAPAWPPHIVRALLEHAAATGATCPITMETIRTDAPADTYTITPCGHVFVATALTAWTTTHRACPECRAAL
jgi:hypothetical protein